MGSVTYMLGHSVANRNALGTCSYWVGCIFDVGARDDCTASEKKGATNVEVGVWACFNTSY